MPSKPKTQVDTQEGTAIYNILDYLIPAKDTNEFDNYETWVELNYHLRSEGVGNFTPERVSQAVRWFNEGVYKHKGKTVDGVGMILVKPLIQTQIKDGKEDPTFLYDVNSEEREQNTDEVIENFEKACAHFGINPEDAAGSYLKYQNVTIKIPRKANSVKVDENLYEKVKSKLEESGFFGNSKIVTKTDTNGARVGVLNITDLHLGAFVRGLNKTPDFDQNVLRRRLETVTDYVNKLGFDVVRVNILGDIIHSVTGRNHPNTFKECEQGLLGAQVITLAAEILDKNFLSRIKNLGKINMIGGNHGRLEDSTSNDSKSGGENLIYQMLLLKGYDLKFDPLVIVEKIDGIVYTLLHGDKGVSKRPVKDILWDYSREHGEKGDFHFLLSGHLHSRISKMSAKSIEKFELVGGDSIDCRSQVLPSIYSGDSYSDDNNWFSCCGFMVCYNDGNGKPVTIDYPLV